MTETTASVDGDNGLGLVVGPKANQIAMDKAKKYGSGWVSVSNTNHYGIAGYYSLQALKQGMIGTFLGATLPDGVDVVERLMRESSALTL